MAKALTQGKVLTALHKGEVLSKTQISEPGKSKVLYRLGDGRKVKPELVDQLIADHLIIPNGDGLFGDSQTYRIARGEELVRQ